MNGLQSPVFIGLSRLQQQMMTIMMIMTRMIERMMAVKVPIPPNSSIQSGGGGDTPSMETNISSDNNYMNSYRRATLQCFLSCPQL